MDLAADRGAQVRRRDFFAGWGGVLLSLVTGGFVVALLVGWVLLWVSYPGGISPTLLTLGCIAFTLVLGLLATLQRRLGTAFRLRQVEAAFLAGMSHALRTPVSAILAAAQALERPDLLPAQRDRLLGAIIMQTRNLALRVDNVLEAGRLDVESQEFGVEPFSLARLVGAAIEAVRPVVEARGGELDVTLDETLVVRADDRAIRLMLDNLLDNAVKAAAGPPRVRVALGRSGAYAVLRIADEGTGFEPQSRGRLFGRLRRFRRSDVGRTGHGLGLPLARAIARGHNGDLYLYSDGPGTGAQAEVWLPLHEGA